jgi:hypothetical protein
MPRIASLDPPHRSPHASRTTRPSIPARVMGRRSLVPRAIGLLLAMLLALGPSRDAFDDGQPDPGAFIVAMQSLK